jgi:ATP-dependent Zn protease
MKTKRAVFFVVLVMVASLVWMVSQQHHAAAKATYSEFIAQVEAGQVKNAIITAERTGADPVTYSLRDGTRLETIVPSDYREILATMHNHMVNIEIRDAATQWPRIAANSSPFLILLAFWFVMMLKMRNRPAAG